MDNELSHTGEDTEVGEEPPVVNIWTIISAFRNRGIVAAMNDEVLGPHNHLFFLLCIVFFITIIIGIIQLAI